LRTGAVAIAVLKQMGAVPVTESLDDYVSVALSSIVRVSSFRQPPACAIF
jgi:hypothetical protein